ncbi:hypothetical protein [Bradyrhizobium sp. Ash2021]|uniref:hypothetical protein n=1 Tax=Bradyrhizobium sp. Ash2021 TaxID=2954771 RepID=UPI002816046E|nr:hypothetical protein [Bradyrhizobium sp. Ash2021]WMT78863.1 hypothetical protein NL528_22065 [Bradyrhizobium sp. Ash2021]
MASVTQALLFSYGVPGGGGPSLWTPARLSTLKMWFRGDDAGSVDAAAVATWPDASGNSNDATQSLSPNKPTMDVTTGLGGHRVVNFDATASQAMVLPSTLLSGFSSGAVVFVLKLLSDPPGDTVLSGNPLQTTTTGNNPSLYPWAGDSNIYDGFGSTERHVVGNPSTSLATWHIGSFHSQTNLYRYYLNGVQFFTTSTNTVDWSFTAPLLGRWFNGGFNYSLAGKMAEILLVNEFLSDADRQKAEGYVAHKYGLQSVLDVSHPYKSAPPT